MKHFEAEQGFYTTELYTAAQQGLYTEKMLQFLACFIFLTWKLLGADLGPLHHLRWSSLWH